jgi:hypothetical protein
MSLTSNDKLIVESIVGKVFEEKFDEKVKPLEAKIDKVITLLDAFAGNIQSHQQQLAMVEGHKDQIEDHEQRITNLEAGSPINA